jgi:hypothetical protein
MNIRNAGPPAKPNGRSGASPSREAGRRRSTPRAAAGVSSDPGAQRAEQLASFSEFAPLAMDAAAWPVHLTLWLEPNLQMVPPKTSGLRVERNHRIPARTFLGGVEPLYGSLVPVTESRPALPDIGLQFPRSGLKTVGWEPRNILTAAGSGSPNASKSNPERRGKESGQ